LDRRRLHSACRQGWLRRHANLSGPRASRGATLDSDSQGFQSRLDRDDNNLVGKIAAGVKVVIVAAQSLRSCDFEGDVLALVARHAPQIDLTAVHERRKRWMLPAAAV